MLTPKPNFAVDGFATLERGVDSGRNPALLEVGQAAYACNTVFRGGYAQPRPAFHQRVVGFNSGMWQGAHFYDSPTIPGFVFSIAGRIHFVDPISGEHRELTDAGDRNSDRLPQSWFCQVEEYMIVQNGQDRPFIWNGASSSRAAEKTDPDGNLRASVPVGTIMAYGMGRLWVVLPNRRYFEAGDLVYSVTGKTEDALYFSENSFLNGGGYFTVPVASGPITAMRFLAQLDTSTGHGPLMVFTDRSAFTCRAPVDREVWAALNYPIQTVALLSNGAQAQESTILVNGDIWYRARDGVRSLALAQRQAGDWSSTPQSREVSRVVNSDAEHLLDRSSAILFDNRLLMTAQPRNVSGYGTTHDALLVLDFDPLSSLQSRLSPAWNGVWSGVRFLQVVKGTFSGRERAYAFVLNSNNAVELWEISKNDQFDNDDERITWFFETKAFPFQTPFDRKELAYAEIWRDRMVGEIDTDVKYRPDQFPCWIDWHNWSECITYRRCTWTRSQCPTIANYQPQYRPRVRLPLPSNDDCDITTNRPYRHASEFQFRIQTTGFCRYKSMRFHARHVMEQHQGACPPAESCIGLECCNEEEFPRVGVMPAGTEEEDGTEGTVLVTDEGEILVTDEDEQIIVD